MNIIKKTAASLAAAAAIAVSSALPASAAVRGDLNNDGTIDSFDVVLCRRNIITMFSGGQTDLLAESTVTALYR